MRALKTIVLLSGQLWTLAAPASMAHAAEADRQPSAFAATVADSRLPVMVYFTDKGIQGKGGLQAALNARRAQFSARALKRRAKMGLAGMTFEDLSVSMDYVRQIEALGARRRQTLNWFNAASFEMTGSQAQTAAGLGFVKRIDMLASYRKALEPEAPILPEPAPASPPSKAHLLNYGPSFTQDSLINVPICHDSGYSGSGVLVAMFDNGFYKSHPAFDSILSSVRMVDEWDFYLNSPSVDSVVHGTRTWSAAGGYVPGQLIGPAYKSSWAIYRTEVDAFEQNVEEDYWAAALQRADSIGADVISSSLGYRNFDAGQHSYPYSELDGNTAICTQAARHAAALGIIVCNAMGNSGPSNGTILAPSDADSILSIGAVNSSGIITGFSSRGPTYDGRPKPEVCAQGLFTYLADTGNVAQYNYYNGTSYATPLVAGACALVLEAHPEWTPLQVREALMMTASRASNPDSSAYGWGVIDAWAAIHYGGSGVGHDHPGITASPALSLSCRPNPARSGTVLSFVMPRSGGAAVSVYDIAGRLVRELPAVRLSAGPGEVRWDGRDRAGYQAVSGVYLCRVNAGGRTGIVKAVLLR